MTNVTGMFCAFQELKGPFYTVWTIKQVDSQLGALRLEN